MLQILALVCLGLIFTAYSKGCSFSIRSERRTGYLKLYEGQCLLAPTPKWPEEDCKETEASCRRLKHLLRLSRSDGLNKDFCTNHSELIGKKVTIEGTRVSGSEISQDCTNRSCFDSVSLKDK